MPGGVPDHGLGHRPQRLAHSVKMTVSGPPIYRQRYLASVEPPCGRFLLPSSCQNVPSFLIERVSMRFLNDYILSDQRERTLYGKSAVH